MKVFVTGATGVLGRPVVRRLVGAGHTVRGLSRSPENAALRRLGAEPVDADLFDLVSLQMTLRDADAVFHLATKIPPSTRAWRLSAWAENDRIRRDGTRALVTAALASPTVKTFVYPSFALVYPESGDEWIDAENTPAAPTAIEATTLDAEAEVARFAAAGDGRRGLSLRMGALYSPDAPSAQDQLRIARLGFVPVPGRPAGYMPLVWVDDAANALVVGLERGDSGVYDIVDDHPLRRAEIAAAIAAAVGRNRLRSLPAWLMDLAGGLAQSR